MNLLPNNSSKLNNVIFKNKNQKYGAYAIRETYNNAIVKSLICLTGMLTLIFGSAFTYNRLHFTLPEVKVIANFDDPTVDSLYITEVHNEPIVEKPIINEPVVAAAPTGVVTATTIIDNAVDAVTTSTNQVSVAGLGDPNSNGTSTTSVVSSTEAATPLRIGGGELAPSEPVNIAEFMPVFNTEENGVLRYVSQNISYPEMARNIGVEGTVYVSFIVNEKGKVENAKVLRGIGYGCDEEVLRMLTKMPLWLKPGKNGDRAVKVRYNIPVRFKLR